MRSEPASRRRAATLLALACGACFSPTGGDTATTVAATTDSTSTSTDGGTSTTVAGPTTSTAGATTSTSGVLTTGSTAASSTTTTATDVSSTATTTGGTCGDEFIDLNEECDDGNNLDGDGCDADCKFEPACGNGIIETGEACDDGNNLEGDGCDALCESEVQQRFVFLTSVKFTPSDLMSLGGGGERCKTLAESAEALPELMGRNWVAWLSDADTDAVEQLGDFSGDYILPDEHVIVAKGVAGLTSGQLLAPINETEKGVAGTSIVPCDQNPDDPVWTGSFATGIEAAGFHCTGWSTDAGVAFMGVYSATDSNWTECGTLVCTSLARLYCVEI